MKVLIIGPSGAGKTTLAGQLGARFKLPVHLRQRNSARNQEMHLARARVGIAPPDAVDYRHQ